MPQFVHTFAHSGLYWAHTHPHIVQLWICRGSSSGCHLLPQPKQLSAPAPPPYTQALLPTPSTSQKSQHRGAPASGPVTMSPDVQFLIALAQLESNVRKGIVGE